MLKTRRIFKTDLIGCVKDSGLLILAVNHKQFLNLDFALIKSEMENPCVLDTRNFFNRKTLEDLGFEYHLLGAKQTKKLGE
jgi:UDP-N-acetyl-D-mannosaminuronate dehydrogenase